MSRLSRLQAARTMMSALTDWLGSLGPVLVFFNVLLQQLGLPLPVYPTLLLVGSTAPGWGELALAWLAAIGASMLADRIWYVLGRRHGYRVLRLLCRLSINPGTCVTQTEQRFARWGAPALLVAKFVPGFSAVAAPVAGLSRMPPARFTLAAAGGAALWSGVGLLSGRLLHAQVERALAFARVHGWIALALLATMLGLWLALKFWRRHRFRRWATMEHVEAADLLDALSGVDPPRLLDFRGPAAVAADGRVPTAEAAELRGLARQALHWPRHQAIVTMCACPQDATAIHAARVLQRLGFHEVRPLRGGYEAWRAAQAQGLSPA